MGWHDRYQRWAYRPRVAPLGPPFAWIPTWAVAVASVVAAVYCATLGGWWLAMTAFFVLMGVALADQAGFERKVGHRV